MPVPSSAAGRQLIDTTLELLEDFLVSCVADSGDGEFGFDLGIDGFVDSENAVDATVTEYDLLTDLRRTVESPDHRLGGPVTKLESPHR
jgi:hypothetical protein